MADYGNNFTGNSGNYHYETNGHNEGDSDWTIVNRPNNTKVVQGKTEDAGNNVTVYVANYDMLSYSQAREGNKYVTYFPFQQNRNIQGSITGNFSVYPFNDKNSSKMIQPTKLDDTQHGVSPYSNSNDNPLTRSSLTFKGTTDTRGYRKTKIQYTPYIEFDKNSNNDGTMSSHATVDSTSQYDAFQTFYNEVDPSATLSISISNHDDPKSSSPIFCSLRNSSSNYKINHSYNYNPYVNSATWNNTNYLSFTYNTLPTYPKTLVFTYGSNYNSISYDGGSIKIEAKARYNNTYDRFTTSTASDDGFSSYARYVDVTYSLGIYHSSTKPSGISSYTFRIWQPGSKLGISYSWSIDGNPSWVHLSTTSGNNTTVSFDDIGDDKPSIGGTLSISNLKTTLDTDGTSTGSISGNSWGTPTNKNSRSCTVRQNMKVTNCIAQNITPKDQNNQPYQTVTLTQNGMYWNNPAFDMKWKIQQISKDGSTYNDDYEHGYPTVSIGGIQTTDASQKVTSWKYNDTNKTISIHMPKFDKPWNRSNTHGNISNTIQSGTIGHLGGSKTITLTPSITFEPGYYSGLSKRTWKLINVSNDKTEEEYGSVGKFPDTILTMNGANSTTYTSGTCSLSWSTNTGTLSSFNTSWTNNNDAKTFSISMGDNSVYKGVWQASCGNGTIYIATSTKNKYPISIEISFNSPNTSEDGTVTISNNKLSLSQDGDTISGTISFSSSGACSLTKTSIPYPVNYSGNATNNSAGYTLSSALRRYVTGAGNLGVSIYSPSGNIVTSGETIYVNSTGSPSTHSDSDKRQYWYIYATSDIVSKFPKDHDSSLIGSGSITPLDPGYHYEYNYDNTGWTKSTSCSIGSNEGSITSNTNASLNKNNNDDVASGKYNYVRGYYHRNSTSDKTHTVKIRVVDDNDSNLIFDGGSNSKTQNKDNGDDFYRGGSWHIYPKAENNCTVSTTDITFNGTTNNNVNNVGLFTVSPYSPISDPSGNQGSSSDISNYIYNYSDKLNEGYWSLANGSESVTFTGKSETFYPGQTPSITIGVTSSTPDSITWNYTGKKTWNYKYKYSVTSTSDSTRYYTEKEGSGSNGPRSAITYYRYIDYGTGDGWQRLSTNGSSTTTATSAGTYVVKVAWINGNSVIRKHSSDSYTITIVTTVYRLRVSISGGGNKSAFADSGWTLTANVTVQESADGGVNWTNSSSSPSISYSWSTGSTSNTASVGLDEVSGGADGSSIGTTKTVTVTVTASGYQQDSDSVELGKYGKTYYNA